MPSHAVSAPVAAGAATPFWAAGGGGGGGDGSGVQKTHESGQTHSGRVRSAEAPVSGRTAHGGVEARAVPRDVARAFRRRRQWRRRRAHLSHHLAIPVATGATLATLAVPVLPRADLAEALERWVSAAAPLRDDAVRVARTAPGRRAGGRRDRRRRWLIRRRRRRGRVWAAVLSIARHALDGEADGRVREAIAVGVAVGEARLPSLWSLAHPAPARVAVKLVARPLAAPGVTRHGARPTVAAPTRSDSGALTTAGARGRPCSLDTQNRRIQVTLEKED
eukprot:scaffold30467_cov101-Isochrysis_galbana.AAC.3